MQPQHFQACDPISPLLHFYPVGLVFQALEPLLHFLLVDWTGLDINRPSSKLFEIRSILSRFKALLSVPGISVSAFLIRLTQLTLHFPHGFFAQPPRQAVLFTLYYLLWHCGRQGCSLAVCGWLPYLCSWAIRRPYSIKHEGLLSESKVTRAYQPGVDKIEGHSCIFRTLAYYCNHTSNEHLTTVSVLTSF